tara:strand:- start:106 stop:471 length:366 start_codon:yes stop_codon:yes gene_type:complete
MKTGRKITGGKYHKPRKKKFYERHNQERETILSPDTKTKKLTGRGKTTKTITLKTNKVNITDGKSTKTATIKNVLETPQNRFLARQNRLLKGAIIETTVGKARITNRPSQEGHVNALLIKE